MNWDAWRPATCMPDSCFCEAVREGVIRQPTNTWSSHAFCDVALVMFAELGRPSRLSKLEAVLFATSAFLVGVTSAFYHASLTFLGQSLDVQSMYLVVALALAVNVDALRPGKPKLFLPLYLGLNVALGALLVWVPEFRRFGFGGGIAAVVVTEVALRRRGLRDWPLRPLLVAIALQAVAFIIWNLDRTHTVCDPMFPIQGHAVWHTLGALASYALWRYFRKSTP